MIVITGATGALNGATVEHLLDRMDASEIGVSVRDPAKAQHLADRGVRVRRGSYEDPDDLRRAFEGADQVLLVSSNDPHADAVPLHAAAIEAAVSAGASRILYTSHQGAGLGSPFSPAHDHAATEQLLADSGVAWTSLRNGFYAHTLSRLLGPWQETGSVATPTDGPVSWTWREDAAEGAAAILTALADGTDGGAFDGPVTLTASEAPDFEQLTATLSELSGRTITREALDDEDWVARQTAAGQPEPRSRFTLGFFHAAHEGRFAGTSPMLSELLGREPRSAREILNA